jgi:hypothetical protein
VIDFDVAPDAENVTVSVSDVVEVEASAVVKVTLPDASDVAVVATGLLRPEVVIVTVWFARAAPN